MPQFTIKKSKKITETIQWNENKPWHEAFLDCLDAYLKLDRVKKASRWGETARRKKIAMKFQTLLKNAEGKSPGEIYTQHYLSYHFLQNQKDVQVKQKEAFHDQSHLGTLLTLAYKQYSKQATEQLNALIDKPNVEQPPGNPFDETVGPLSPDDLSNIHASASGSHDQSAKIKKLEDDIEKLQSLVKGEAGLNQKIFKLEQEKQRLEKALETQKQELKASQAKKDEEIKGKAKEIERLHEELNKKEDELVRKQEELKPLQEKLEKKKGEIQDFKTREQQIIDEKNDLSKRNAASETEIAQQKTVIKNLSSENNAAKAKVAELNKQVEALKQEKRKVEEELTATKEIYITPEVFKATLEEKVTPLEEQINTLKREKEKNEETIRQLTEERDNLKQKNAEQKQEIENKISENEQLQTANGEQATILNAMQKELRDLKKNHESLQTQHEKNEGNYNDLKKGKDALVSQIGKLKSELAEKDVEISNLKRENTQLRNQVNSLVKLFKATWRYFIDFLRNIRDSNQNSVPKTYMNRFLEDSDRTDEKSGNIVLPAKIDVELDKEDKARINETDALNPGLVERAKNFFGSFFKSNDGVPSSSGQTDNQPKQDVQGSESEKAEPAEFDEIPLAEPSGDESPAPP